MELDDLKAGWAELDRRMAALELASATEGAAAGVRAELTPLRWGQAAQAVFGLVVAMGAGSFWFDHRDTAGPLVAGLLLHAYGIAMIIAAARNLFLAARASASAPVVDLQARVAALRAWRIREGRWFGIIGCFMWVPMVVWAFAMLGVDIVRVNPLFVGLQVVAAFVCLGVFFVLWRLAKVPEGPSVRRARERLDEVARFTAGGPV